MLLVCAVAAAALHSFGAASAPVRSSHGAYRRTTIARMQFGQLPPEVSVVLKPSYAGASRGGRPMVVGTESELRAIWNAMVKVYGNRDDALAAVRKNQQVILPYINKPSTIIGAHGVLVDMFGKTSAAELIRKNPGVLACDPKTLADTDPKEIEKAANFVVWFDGLDGDLKASIPFLTFAGLITAIGGRIVACSGAMCGTADEWDLKGGLGVQALEAVKSAASAVLQ